MFVLSFMFPLTPLWEGWGGIIKNQTVQMCGFSPSSENYFSLFLFLLFYSKTYSVLFLLMVLLTLWESKSGINRGSNHHTKGDALSIQQDKFRWRNKRSAYLSCKKFYLILGILNETVRIIPKVTIVSEVVDITIKPKVKTINWFHLFIIQWGRERLPATADIDCNRTWRLVLK